MSFNPEEWEEEPEKVKDSRDSWMEDPSSDQSQFSELFKTVERDQKLSVLKAAEEAARKAQIHAERSIKTSTSTTKTSQWGDKGSSWRMIKLKRTFEIAAEESVEVEIIAQERFESLEEFRDAVNERDYLENLRSDRSSQSSASTVRKSQFKAPVSRSTSQTQSEAKRRFAEIARTKQDDPLPEPKKIVKMVAINTIPILSTDELNKLYSKVLKARLMKSKQLDTLESEYDYEKRRASTQKDVIIVRDQPEEKSHGGKRKREKDTKVVTHDNEGNRLEYDDTSSRKTLHDLIRDEKMDNSSYDTEIAHQISTDSRFKNDLDYMEDASDNLSRQKKEVARGISVSSSQIDKSRQEKHLDDCRFCYDPEMPPQITIISMGIKAYLALPETIDMVPFHCFIVPLQHVTSTLELDDDVWDEIRNFKKCLIRMSESKKMGVLFMEQVISIKKQLHTVIECIPLPRSAYEDAPAYFKESITESEGEWTQHKALIKTDAKGFRKSMVKNLSYFHIWFTPDSGYGHVIEDSRAWPIWFGNEVIASMLDLAPEKWRKPKMIEPKDAAVRSKTFLGAWSAFDWTKMLD